MFKFAVLQDDSQDVFSTAHLDMHDTNSQDDSAHGEQSGPLRNHSSLRKRVSSKVVPDDSNNTASMQQAAWSKGSSQQGSGTVTRRAKVGASPSSIQKSSMGMHGVHAQGLMEAHVGNGLEVPTEAVKHYLENPEESVRLQIFFFTAVDV